MAKPRTISIHGKNYIPVSERLKQWHNDIKGNDQDLSIVTEVLQYAPQVVIKATISWNKRTFTGISAANVAKPKEKENPYEVAETSAVGRALAFAGYEIELGIASAEEVQKSNFSNSQSSNPPVRLSDPQMRMIFSLLKQKNHTKEELEKKYGEIEKLDKVTASTIIDGLTKLPDAATPEKTDTVDPNDIPENLGEK